MKPPWTPAAHWAPEVPVVVRLIQDDGRTVGRGQPVANRSPGDVLTWRSAEAVTVVRAEADVMLDERTLVVPLPFGRWDIPAGGSITLQTPQEGHWVSWEAV
jgi:hypothetical protein